MSLLCLCKCFSPFLLNPFLHMPLNWLVSLPLVLTTPEIFWNFLPFSFSNVVYHAHSPNFCLLKSYLSFKNSSNVIFSAKLWVFEWGLPCCLWLWVDNGSSDLTVGSGELWKVFALKVIKIEVFIK